MASGMRKKGLFTQVAQDLLGPLPGNKKKKKRKPTWVMEAHDGTTVKTIPVRNPNEIAF